MKHIILLSALFAIVIAGCGDSRILITGTITYEDDGSPMNTGNIQFESAANTYSGLIEDGKYKTGGQKAVQGIPPGEYKVWISGAYAQVSDGDKTGLGVLPLVADEYCSATKTPLSFEVKPGGATTFDIKVKRPERKRPPSGK
ncbi:hypothetical protein FACS1894170_02660 [Planctomycetales bacterium]|nr:hypothetical protein FACS1894170_02660 [Planctomycetales bacterium]